MLQDYTAFVYIEAKKAREVGVPFGKIVFYLYLYSLEMWIIRLTDREKCRKIENHNAEEKG